MLRKYKQNQYQHYEQQRRGANGRQYLEKEHYVRNNIKNKLLLSYGKEKLKHLGRSFISKYGFRIISNKKYQQSLLPSSSDAYSSYYYDHSRSYSTHFDEDHYDASTEDRNKPNLWSLLLFPNRNMKTYDIDRNISLATSGENTTFETSTTTFGNRNNGISTIEDNSNHNHSIIDFIPYGQYQKRKKGYRNNNDSNSFIFKPFLFEAKENINEIENKTILENNDKNNMNRIAIEAKTKVFQKVQQQQKNLDRSAIKNKNKFINDSDTKTKSTAAETATTTSSRRKKMASLVSNTKNRLAASNNSTMKVKKKIIDGSNNIMRNTVHILKSKANNMGDEEVNSQDVVVARVKKNKDDYNNFGKKKSTYTKNNNRTGNSTLKTGNEIANNNAFCFANDAYPHVRSKKDSSIDNLQGTTISFRNESPFKKLSSLNQDDITENNCQCCVAMPFLQSSDDDEMISECHNINTAVPSLPVITKKSSTSTSLDGDEDYDSVTINNSTIASTESSATYFMKKLFSSCESVLDCQICCVPDNTVPIPYPHYTTTDFIAGNHRLINDYQDIDDASLKQRQDQKQRKTKQKHQPPKEDERDDVPTVNNYAKTSKKKSTNNSNYKTKTNYYISKYSLSNSSDEIDSIIASLDYKRKKFPTSPFKFNRKCSSKKETSSNRIRSSSSSNSSSSYPSHNYASPTSLFTTTMEEDDENYAFCCSFNHKIPLSSSSSSLSTNIIDTSPQHRYKGYSKNSKKLPGATANHHNNGITVRTKRSMSSKTKNYDQFFNRMYYGSENNKNSLDDDVNSIFISQEETSYDKNDSYPHHSVSNREYYRHVDHYNDASRKANGIDEDTIKFKRSSSNRSSTSKMKAMAASASPFRKKQRF